MTGEKEWITAGDVMALFPERPENAHKGDFGHALLVAGSRGMMGAALLATGAALRSGCGLVTVHVPEGERMQVHVAYPSSIVSLDTSDTCFSVLPASLSRYSAVGAGPGLGQSEETVAALGSLMENCGRMVIDADALNIIAFHPHYLKIIPRGSVLTPHIGELKRLLRSAVSSSFIDGFEVHGDEVWRSVEERTDMVRALAAAAHSVIVVKGAHTMVCLPSGNLKFNPTGNPGMAKGGSGDVLTGLVTGLMARGLSPGDAAMAGVYLHGLAGDRAAGRIGQESMNAADILGCLRI